jgi:hypothetical protein
MWATLALTAVLAAPAQGGDLALKNVRPTLGILGQDRKEGPFLVGDLLVLSYDIEGLKLRDDGQILYTVGLELFDKNGKSQFKQEPKDLEVPNPFASTRLPAFALVELRNDTAPGDYTMKVTITDRNAKVTKSLEHKFQVASTRLGFVQTNLTDPAYRPVPALAVPGQTYMVNFAVVGFDLDPKTKQPHVEVSMRVLENGKPVLAKPATGGAKEVGDDFKKMIPFQFPLFVHRPGKFVIEINVKDSITGKTEQQTLKLEVVEAPR